MDAGGRRAKDLGDLPHRASVGTETHDSCQVHMNLGASQMNTGKPSTVLSQPNSLHKAGSLLRGDPRENGYEQIPHGTGGIQPSLLDAYDLNSPPIQVEDGLEIPGHGSSQPVDCPDAQDVVLPTVSILQHLVQDGPLLYGAGLFLHDGDHFVPALLSHSLKGWPLVLNVLFDRGSPQIQTGTLRLGADEVHSYTTLDDTNVQSQLLQNGGCEFDLDLGPDSDPKGRNLSPELHLTSDDFSFMSDSIKTDGGRPQD